MRADTKIQLVAGLVIGVCVALSGALSAAVSAAAGRAQLVYTDVAEEGERPEVALGVAMGAFRGIFVNILWLRAEKMKQEGKFHEAVALRRAITRLQPHFPQVWAFQAWDLAYNISVEVPTAAERWQWVNAGVNLLRSAAIPRNPHDTLLHKELAWIFIHKIQGRADNAHAYYKRELAKEWTFVLGPPPSFPKPEDPDVQQIWKQLQQDWARRLKTGDIDPERRILDEPNMRDALQKADIERRVRILQRIANAPNTIDEVIARQPLVKELLDRLKRDADVEPGFNLLRLVEMQRALEITRVEYAKSNIGNLRFNLADTERNKAFERLLLTDTQYIPAWQALLPTVRKRLLIDKYNMEPPRMIRYTREFGPLDWRLAAAHAVYWASRGVEEGLKRRNSKDFDRVNTDRIVLQSVQECFRWGELFYNVIDDTYVSLPNMNFIDSYTEALDLLNKRRDEKFEGEQRSFREYLLGYHNFLRDVIRVLYRRGETEEARKYFTYLRNTTQRNTTDTVLQLAEQSKTLEKFVAIDLDKRITSADFALTELTATLHAAWVRGLLRGNRDSFNSQIEYANLVHKKYMEAQNRMTAADPNANRMGSAIMPPQFIDVVMNSFVSFLVSGAIGQVQGHLLWERAPLGLRQASYDLLVSVLKPREPNFDQLYPAPPGLEEYRAARQQMNESDPDAQKRLMQFAPG